MGLQILNDNKKSVSFDDLEIGTLFVADDIIFVKVQPFFFTNQAHTASPVLAVGLDKNSSFWLTAPEEFEVIKQGTTLRVI